MKLTAKQKEALQDASNCNGKIFQLPERPRHSPNVLAALVKLGLLKAASVGVIWTLTSAGREVLSQSEKSPVVSRPKPRYKDARKQRFYDSLLALAADRESEMYHQGRPRRGAGHRAAFWDGYAGLQRTANVLPGTLSAVAYAAGLQFAKNNPDIAKDEAVWTPSVTRQGEPTEAT